MIRTTSFSPKKREQEHYVKKMVHYNMIIHILWHLSSHQSTGIVMYRQVTEA